MRSNSANQLNHLSQVTGLGTRGGTDRGDIAIDKVSIVAGKCTGNETFACIR